MFTGAGKTESSKKVSLWYGSDHVCISAQNFLQIMQYVAAVSGNSEKVVKAKNKASLLIMLPLTVSARYTHQCIIVIRNAVTYFISNSFKYDCSC